MNEEAQSQEVSETYQRFARLEARGRSPLYEEISEGVGGDVEVLALIASLPAPKRQPNLLLGAERYLYGTATDYAKFRKEVVGHWDELSATMLTLRTQTNEVARCATLLPLLLTLPQPLALFEVGASAGLCLLLDRYRYDYGAGEIGPRDSPVILQCQLRGAHSLTPTHVPEIVWRGGCDLAPIDVRDGEAVRWLEALIWPGDQDRLVRFRGAIQIARENPPHLFARDLRQGIGDLVDDVPEEATLVVFHSAVLTYVPPEDRDAFVSEIKTLGATWIANEGAGVVPNLLSQLPEYEVSLHEGDFLLSKDGVPVAWTQPHGSWVEWREPPVRFTE
ncbi:MAG TPA: DUF2332 domain-containing protein [Acidimicrobiales bacterium]|nr:DUF2332 domain-containing protein [Acidimicrobiales bacterium]